MSRKLTRSSIGLALAGVGGIALYMIGLGDLPIAAWFLGCGLSSLGANIAHGVEDAESIKAGVRVASSR